jgi:hypothetical protein
MGAADMKLNISISPEAEARLRERASATGEPLEQVASRFVEEALRRPSLNELLAPLRAEFEASGMTDDELAELLERAKHEMRAVRRARRAS